jgi:hypothetical protein
MEKNKAEKKCAICGRTIYPRFHLCKPCNILYGDTEWAKELIKMERHEYQSRVHDIVLCFSDVPNLEEEEYVEEDEDYS